MSETMQLKTPDSVEPDVPVDDGLATAPDQTETEAPEDLITAALRAVEEASKTSQAASPQAILVNAILW